MGDARARCLRVVGASGSVSVRGCGGRGGGGFRQLLPLLAGRRVPLLAGGGVCSSCVGGVVLRAAGAWAVGAGAQGRLRRGGRAVIRWVCGVRAGDEVGSDSLLAGLGIRDLGVVLRAGGVVWTCGVRCRLDFRGARAECGCAGGIWRAGGVVGWGDREWQRGAGCGLCWPSGSLWVGGVLGGDLSKSPTLRRGKRALKRI